MEDKAEKTEKSIAKFNKVFILVAFAIFLFAGYIAGQYLTSVTNKEKAVENPEPEGNITSEGNTTSEKKAPEEEKESEPEVIKKESTDDTDSLFVFVAEDAYPKPCFIYVVDLIKNDEPIVKMKVSHDECTYTYSNSNLVLAGDRMYFIDDDMLKWMDFDGNAHSLKFTSKISQSRNSFLISSDHTKIAWVEGFYQNNSSDPADPGKSSSKIVLAKIDGSNKKTILEKNWEGNWYIELMQFSASGEDIYFSRKLDGLGGYIIFGGYTGLNRVNIRTKKEEEIFNLFAGDDFDANNYISDLSSDETLITYFKRKEKCQEFVIRNIETDQETIIDIPLGEDFRGGGNAYFSPDDKKIAYNIAHWDPDNELYRTIIIDSSGKNQKTIFEDSEKGYEVIKWISNDKILIVDSWEQPDKYYAASVDSPGLIEIKLK